MPSSSNPTNAPQSNQMFEEHLAEIALDWVRAPAQIAPAGGNVWRPATGFITLLEESQAELIDLVGSPAIDLTESTFALQEAA